MTAAVTMPAGQARVERGRAGERPLPVLPALEPLLPPGGLRRGSAVAVRGSASLLLALLAGPSGEGAWCAVVGLPALGLVAAEETGVALDRLALVPDPGPDWAAVTGALLDAVDVVAVAPRGRVLDGDVRRLAARARQRGAVLLPYGAVRWPGAELRLSVAAGTWEGLDAGSGRLRARRVVVRGEGRGSAARARELRLWLPAPGGGVRADNTPLLRAVPDLPPAPPARARSPGLPGLPGPPGPTGPAAPRSGRLRAVPDPGPHGSGPHGSGPRSSGPRSSGPRGPGAEPGPGSGSAGPGPASGGAPPPRPRPVGPPVPAGRSAAIGGGGFPVPPPPVGARAGGRPRIPPEALARLRPASTLPRPPRRAAPG